MTIPERVWDAAILRGLDARARRDIEAAARARVLAPGEVVYRPGDPADALFVVGEGAVSVRAAGEGREIRRAGPAEAFGEEATLRAAQSRRTEARAAEAATIAAIPAHVLERAVVRAGRGELEERRRRAVRRAVASDAIAASALGRRLGADELALILDGGVERELGRGEVLFHEGDPADDAFFVVGGTLQLQREEAGRLRILGYAGPGDLLGEEELGLVRPHAAVALGPTLLLELRRDTIAELARVAPEALEGARRVRLDREHLQELAHARAPGVTRPLGDLHRLAEARSLLVIDELACVRCGHCVASCADAHGDGVSRLVRRGDRVHLSVIGQERVLLVPSSCQHCRNPACMIDCPTAAIGRSATGEVVIDEALCTGCGACVKACPWDNVQLSPRHGGARAEVRASRSAEVAVKCDLCAGSAGGPACVSACPTDALARVDPREVLGDLGGMLGARAVPAPPSPRASAWPTMAAAALVGGALPFVHLGPVPSGVLAGALAVLLAAYGAVKRVRRVRATLAATGLRAHATAHVALGLLFAGAALGHAHAHAPTTLGGALALACLGASVLGVLGAALARFVPAALTRIERSPALPEELAPRARELEARIFRELSGRSERAKALFRHVLDPYDKSLLGAARLVASRRSLRQEEDALRLRVRAVLGDRASAEKLAEVEPLLRTVVERRSLRAQRVLQGVLRGWLVLHVTLSATALALLALHATAVAWR